MKPFIALALAILFAAAVYISTQPVEPINLPMDSIAFLVR